MNASPGMNQTEAGLKYLIICVALFLFAPFARAETLLRCNGELQPMVYEDGEGLKGFGVGIADAVMKEAGISIPVIRETLGTGVLRGGKRAISRLPTQRQGLRHTASPMHRSMCLILI